MSALRTTLSIENLEDRAVPAGNVLAFVDGDGDLRVIGDELGNKVEVYQLDGDSYRVVGHSNTQIHLGNWSAPGLSSVDVHGVYDDIDIDMNDGADTVTLGKIGSMRTDAERDIRINMGNGNDNLFVKNVWAKDDLRAYGDGGKDYVSVYDTWAGFAGLEDGNNYMELHSFERDFGASVNVSNSYVQRDLIIDTGVASNRTGIYITSVYVGDDLVIDTHGGEDTIKVTNTTVTDDIELNTGADRDWVEFTNSSVGDRISLDMDAGNDTAKFTNFSANRGYLSGGLDYDTLIIDSQTNFASVLQEDFEA